MESSTQPAPAPTTTPTRTRSMSAEALIGTGVTVAALGVLLLLLGWAQAMRHVHPASYILLAIGVVFVVIGGIVALAGSRNNKAAEEK